MPQVRQSPFGNSAKPRDALQQQQLNVNSSNELMSAGHNNIVIKQGTTPSKLKIVDMRKSGN